MPSNSISQMATPFAFGRFAYGAQRMAMSSRFAQIIATWPIGVFSLFVALSVSAEEGYRFRYNFAPGSTFVETDRSRQEFAETEQTGQEYGGMLIAQFKQTVEYRVSHDRSSPTPTLSAQIVSLSNKGRRIDFYDGVTFQAKISATGEIEDYSFFGAQPKYKQLIQTVGPLKKHIFWMPRFPDRTMKVGDSVTRSESIDVPGADGVILSAVYELEEVLGHQARFKVRDTGWFASGSIGGTGSLEGHAVFDLDKGMWSSLDLSGGGTARSAALGTFRYKLNRHKEISKADARHSSCDQPTTDVSDPQGVIDHALQLADELLGNALVSWPGSDDDLHTTYRHFHCPSLPQLTDIRDNLAAARRMLDEIIIICIPASASDCGDVRDSAVILPTTQGYRIKVLSITDTLA